VEALLQVPALLETGVWVCHNMIGGPRVQSSSSGSAPSVGYVLLCIGVDSG